MYIAAGQGQTTPKKYKGPNLTLPYNRSRSTQGHHLNKLGSTRAPDAAYQLSRSSAFWFRRRRYTGMAAILVIWPGPFEQTFVPLSHGGSMWNLTLIGQAVSEEKMLKECGRRTTDRWTTDGRRRPTYPISSPVSLRLRWANKAKWDGVECWA